MTALAFWGFLQEVAYAFLFFGVYALYRSALLASHDNRSWLAPVVVMAAASAVALIFSAPRLITIGHEVGLLRRTTTQNYYGYDQILRFFHEGIYGRYFEEGRLLGHGMNLSEGLQLVSSSALSLFVCIGIARPRSQMPRHWSSAILCDFSRYDARDLGTFSPVRFRYRSSYTNLYSLVCFSLDSHICTSDMAVFVSTRRRRHLVPPRARPEDTTFHLFALTGVLFLILIPEGNEAVYYLFGRADFTHTRLSLLAVLPTLYLVFDLSGRAEVTSHFHPSSTRASPNSISCF